VAVRVDCHARNDRAKLQLWQVVSNHDAPIAVNVGQDQKQFVALRVQLVVRNAPGHVRIRPDFRLSQRKVKRGRSVGCVRV
jgi:hypothetical protein